MTNENQLLDEAFEDWSFDDTPEETEVTGGKIHFAKLRVIPPVNIVPFQSGEHFTIPGVFNDVYDEATGTSTRQGLKEFRGMKKGKTLKHHRLYILVAEKENKDGSPYQIIKRFNSWKGRDESVYEWGEKQFPALKAIDAQYREAVKKTGFVSPDSPESFVYARFVQEATGNTWDNDGEEMERHFWNDFTIYPNREAWKAASDEHFAQFQQDDSQPVSQDTGHYPATWGTNIEGMLSGLNGSLKNGMTNDVAANAFQLNGNDFNGQPVDVDRVLNEARNLTAF